MSATDIHQVHKDIAARTGSPEEAKGYRSRLMVSIDELNEKTSPAEDLIRGLTQSSLIERVAHLETMAAKSAEIAKLNDMVAHLRAANTTIHDTLQARIRALRLRLGEDVDPLGLDALKGGHSGGDHG